MRDAPLESILHFAGGVAPPPRRPGERLRWVRDGMGRETWERIDEGEAGGSKHARLEEEAPARSASPLSGEDLRADDEPGREEEADAWVGLA